MIYAKEQKLDVDVFIVYTDNETWAGLREFFSPFLPLLFLLSTFCYLYYQGRKLLNS